jgi:hypothetical protein
MQIDMIKGLDGTYAWHEAAANSDGCNVYGPVTRHRDGWSQDGVNCWRATRGEWRVRTSDHRRERLVLAATAAEAIEIARWDWAV